jgi:hypothetical protein
MILIVPSYAETLGAMALEGNLQDMALVDLIQIFRMGPKTGVLLLTNGLDRGVVYVGAGQLLDAILVRGPERHMLAAGDEAVLQLLQWEEATFIFRHDIAAGTRPPRIEHSSEWLVLEGMRRRANPLRALPHDRMTIETQLQLTALPSNADTGVTLNLDQWRLLSQISSCQDIGTICKRANLGVDEVIRMAAELVAIGVIEIVPPRVSISIRACRRLPEADPQQRLQPRMVGASTMPEAARTTMATNSRGLLNAIMRRVRSL